jgi:hypothetical protein
MSTMYNINMNRSLNFNWETGSLNFNWETENFNFNWETGGRKHHHRENSAQ